MSYRHYNTLFTAPTGVPNNLTVSSTPTSITVTWDPIDCTERNGIITSYTVEFHEVGGAEIPGEVTGHSFTASALTPNTNYTFRVAGVNNNGSGPFIDIIISTGKVDLVSSAAIAIEGSLCPK